MNDALKIARLLSIFVSMTGLVKSKEKTISFKNQLRNEVMQGRVTPSEESIVLKLMGIEKANTISREDDPRLYNILNIVELCTSINMTKSEIYNYINGEFKTGRINQSNRDLLLEAFNVSYTDTKNCKEPERKAGIKYYTLEEIYNHGWSIIIYDGNNRDLEKSKQFWSHDARFKTMLQDPMILANIKANNYKIFGEGKNIRVREYIDRENTPMSTVIMPKDIDARIDPQEIAQAEMVMRYNQKYNENLWMLKQASKNDTSNIKIDKNKLAEVSKIGDIFKLFKR